MVVMTGCNQQTSQIHTYTTPKEADIQKNNPGARADLPNESTSNAPFAPFANRGMPSTPAGPQRMLAAMITQSESTYWFLKAMALPENVEAITEEFEQILSSFDASNPQSPQWKTPEGWTEKPGNSFRFATLVKTLDNGDEVEVAISRLGGDTSGEQQQQYVADNLNRWLKQVNRDPLLTQQIAQSQTFEGGSLKVEQTADKSLWLLDASSPEKAASPTKPATSASPPKPANQSANSAGLKYTIPEGWQEIPATGMRKAAFHISDTEESPTVTVIDLTKSAGDLLPNINRWRREVELEAITEDEIATTTSQITIQNEEATYVVLEGSKQDVPTTMLGIIWIHGSKSWFVKLVGPQEQIEMQKPAFEAFCKSLTIQ